MNQGENDRAELDATAAISLQPENAEVYYTRGRARHAVDDAEGALADIDRALEVDPNMRKALKRRVKLYNELGHYKKMQQDVDRLREQSTGGQTMKFQTQKMIAPLIAKHFQPEPIENLTVTEREFPYRVRADLQHAIAGLFDNGTAIRHFCGVATRMAFQGISFSDLFAPNPTTPSRITSTVLILIEVLAQDRLSRVRNGGRRSSTYQSGLLSR